MDILILLASLFIKDAYADNAHLKLDITQPHPIVIVQPPKPDFDDVIRHLQEIQAEDAKKAQEALETAVAAEAVEDTTQEATPSQTATNEPSIVQRWERVAQCESGGNWAINTGNTFYGGLQFSRVTWAGYAGYSNAHLAPKEVQIAKAEEVRAVRGMSPWPNCGRFF